VYNKKIGEENFPGVLAYNVNKLSKAKMKEVEQEVARIFSTPKNKIDATMVIADKQTITNPTFKAPQPDFDSDTIMVQSKPEAKYFTSFSNLFQNSNGDAKSQTFYIYLPLNSIANRKKRENFMDRRGIKITEKIKEIAR
jgi:hypothetical protein